ncbi:Ribosomal RNA adenine methylase transferase [mine drainage metagenome]|uniref:Ribosomal RNA adenine methylase transferase n=1 Tax=mine drainage metagenome TaxID=410659 RepID=T1ARR3_9ZZZZ
MVISAGKGMPGLPLVEPKRSLGQNFLTDKSIAIMESEFARGRNAIELGPGLGILTAELCKVAKSVLAIEIDQRLYTYLSANLPCDRLKMLNADFFGVDKGAFKGYDILISNVPYNLSSKVLSWIVDNRMEAVLCLQKEFVEHMNANPGTHRYTNLSVFSSLLLNTEEIAKVPSSSFHPRPKVDSKVIHIKVKDTQIKQGVLRVISMIMSHKKKRLKNAVMDSRRYLSMEREEILGLVKELPNAEARPFQLSPEHILESATYIANRIKRA